jgi:hypothetical protein
MEYSMSKANNDIKITIRIGKIGTGRSFSGSFTTDDAVL